MNEMNNKNGMSRPEVTFCRVESPECLNNNAPVCGGFQNSFELDLPSNRLI